MRELSSKFPLWVAQFERCDYLLFKRPSLTCGTQRSSDEYHLIFHDHERIPFSR